MTDLILIIFGVLLIFVLIGVSVAYVIFFIRRENDRKDIEELLRKIESISEL